MTLAICIRCGSEKIGALTPCSHCGFAPENDRHAQAKSLLYCDRHMTPEQLRAVGEALRGGAAPSFDEVALASLVSELERHSGAPSPPIGCRIFVWSLLAVMVALLVFVITVFLRLRR